MPGLADIGSWVDARLGVLDVEASEAAPIRTATFARIVALIVVAEYWARGIPLWPQLGAAARLAVPFASVLGALALLAPRWRRLAFGALAAMHAVTVAREFPAAGNHAYLEVLLLAFCAIFADTPADARLQLRAVRWIAALVLVTSGVQKLAHGYWTAGHYLAFSASQPSFHPVLAWLVSPEDLTRLAGYRREIGDGPYLAPSMRLVLVSNLVWIGEIAAGVALLVPRLRRLAVAAALAMLVAIELGAREVFFGLLFGHMLLLFLPGNPNARLLWPTAALLAALLASRLGLLPAATFY